MSWDLTPGPFSKQATAQTARTSALRARKRWVEIQNCLQFIAIKVFLPQQKFISSSVANKLHFFLFRARKKERKKVVCIAFQMMADHVMMMQKKGSIAVVKFFLEFGLFFQGNNNDSHIREIYQRTAMVRLSCLMQRQLQLFVTSRLLYDYSIINEY